MTHRSRTAVAQSTCGDPTITVYMEQDTNQHWQVQIPELDLSCQVRTLYQLDRWVRCRFGTGPIDTTSRARY
jgi:hypothetical protein